jgi:hypothetical protein
MKKRISVFSLMMLVFLLGTYSQVQAENKVWTDPVTDPVFPTSFLVTYCPCESHFDIVFSNDIALSGAAIPIKWDSVGYLDSSCNIPSVVFSGSRLEDVGNKSIQIDNENRRVLIKFECDPGNFISPGSGKLCQLSLNGLEEATAGNFYMYIDTCFFWDEGIPYYMFYTDTTGSLILPEFADTTWYSLGQINMIPQFWFPEGTVYYTQKGEIVTFEVLVMWDWDLHYLQISDFSPTPINEPTLSILEPYTWAYFGWQTDQADLAGIYTATFETEDYNCRKVDEQTQIFVFDYGDANADFQVNLADVVWLVSYLFLNGPAPQVFLTGDANCDGQINLADAVYLVNYLFINGPEPSCY